MVTIKEIKNDQEVIALISACERQINALNYTEHSIRHSSIVSKWTADILSEIGKDKKTIMLGEIAGYLHDIGNALSRYNHAESGALMAYNILKKYKVGYDDCAEIMMAIGNHDEQNGVPISVVGSALIIADKSDVHKSRVRNKELGVNTNIHDRVNLAVNRSYIDVDKEKKCINTIVEIDNSISSVSDYFEIYHHRMIMCTKAAEFLEYKYELIINGVKLL